MHCTKTGKLTPISILPFLLNRQGTENSADSEIAKSNVDSPTLAGSTMVPTTTTNRHQKPSLSTSMSKPLEKSYGSFSPLSEEQNISLAGFLLSSNSLLMKEYQQRLPILCFSQIAFEKWVQWCRQGQVDPVRRPLNFILDFLTEPF